MKSQCERLLTAMREGMAFTRLDAMLDLGIGNLPARILELRQRGEPVADTWVDVRNRFGKTIQVKSYFLATPTA